MDELLALRRKLYEAMNGPAVILTPLPLRTRARLWFTRRIDRAGIWLVEHDHFKAALALWRMFGLVYR